MILIQSLTRSFEPGSHPFRHASRNRERSKLPAVADPKLSLRTEREMAVSMNWGSLKVSDKVPLKGFGVDIR